MCKIKIYKHIQTEAIKRNINEHFLLHRKCASTFNHQKTSKITASIHRNGQQ